MSNTQEARLFWFLVEILEQNLNGGASSKFIVLNSTDLIADSDDKTHAFGYIRFHHNECIMEGKIMFGSIDRDIVETELNTLISDLEKNKKKQPKEKFFLIQFSMREKDVIQTVVSESHLSFPADIKPHYRHVKIFNGREETIATILHTSENEDELTIELQKLKVDCYDSLFEGYDEFDELTSEDWLLILYTCGTKNVAYDIVNRLDTVSNDDTLTYITDGINIYKAIIVGKSTNIEKLLISLNRMKEYSLNLYFPLDIDVNDEDALPPFGFESLCESNERLEILNKFNEQSIPLTVNEMNFVEKSKIS